MIKRVRKTDQESEIKGVFEHQAKHPWLTATLFVFLFPPAILLIIVVGKALQWLLPDPPPFWIIIPGAPLLVVSFVIGMLIGATVFIFVMKHFFDKTVLAPFYLYPGVPVTSDLSARIFRWAYRHDENL